MKRVPAIVGIVISILITIGIMSIGNVSASEKTGNKENTICGTTDLGRSAGF